MEAGLNEDRVESCGRVEGMDALLFTVSLEVTLQQMKIVGEKTLVTDIIRASLIEMAVAGEWGALRKAICILMQRASEFTMLHLEHERLRSSRSAISNELRLKRQQYRRDLRLADTKITLLADKKEDQQLNSKIQLLYAEKWLNATAEVLELQHTIPRARVPSTDHEKRVHEELRKAYDLQVKENEKKVEYWRVKYSDDTAKMNIQLAERREQLQVAVARRVELQQLYKLHEGEMRAWLTFKRERAARLAREERVRRAATHIQAWWRGQMVRRGLGAFKYLRNAKKSPMKNKKK